MFKKRCAPAILLAFLLILIASAAATDTDWFRTAKTAESEIGISSKAEIVELDPNAYVDYVIINATFFPRESARQQVLSFETDPEAAKGDDLLFRWDDPIQRELAFRIDSRVRTSEGFVKVTGKVRFPAEVFDPDIFAYTKATANIDSDNPKVIRQATGIAEGEDDLYVVVYKTADWVNTHIDYSLSTLTADGSQKASWVLENRYGVCDEITTLFIALLRSVGIPARFVSGVSYTNLDLYRDKWVPHAWAEVYFPGYGWIDYDVTYGEIGYVDASHIKLKDSTDSDEYSTRYEWEGRFVDLRTQRLDITGDVTRILDTLDPYVRIDASAARGEVGFGSHNLIEAEVANPNAFYVATQLAPSQSDGLMILDEPDKRLLLKPGETKSRTWIVRVDDDLDPNFAYTFNVGAYTPRNESGQAQFLARKGLPAATLEEMQLLAAQKEEEETKAYSSEVGLSCEATGTGFLAGETAQVVCEIENRGNSFLYDLAVCLDSCTTINLGIAQAQTLTLSANLTSPGKKDLRVVASNDAVTKSATVIVQVGDRPRIGISEISYPANVTLNQSFAVEFLLTKDSESDPQDVIVELMQGDRSKTWDLDELSANRKFILNLRATDLTQVQNQFTVRVTYHDDAGARFVSEEGFVVTVSDSSWLHRVIMGLNTLSAGITVPTSWVYVSMIVIFGVVMSFIFRGRHGTTKKSLRQLEREERRLEEEEVVMDEPEPADVREKQLEEIGRER